MPMNPPTVLLDGSFIQSLLDPTAEHHESAAATYADLITRFGEQRVLLAAPHTVLQGVDRSVRRGLLAAVDAVQMAGRYRSAGRRVPHHGTTDPEFGALLTLLHRERIRRVASFDARFADLDITIESAVSPALPEPTTDTDTDTNTDTDSAVVASY